ncbi:hypothetical protein ACJ73_08517 [Blastomyces percursus]|uniref:Uncharacterized protein n=1 Tax=Blastomyces percursus TaxID=1658174 RepID=A0A1J9QXU4_9EURO|nr:hypothetical protein ACJ73_08517 [Blastomyces percursus]
MHEVHNDQQIQAFSHASASQGPATMILTPKTPSHIQATVCRPFNSRIPVAGTGTGTTEPLGLSTSVVGDWEGSVILHKGLELILGAPVNVFPVATSRPSTSQILWEV